VKQKQNVSKIAHGSSKWASIAGQKVTVMQRQNGSLAVGYKQQRGWVLEREAARGFMAPDRRDKTPPHRAT
jgi:hypothetical protein